MTVGVVDGLKLVPVDVDVDAPPRATEEIPVRLQIPHNRDQGILEQMPGNFLSNIGFNATILLGLAEFLHGPAEARLANAVKTH